MYKTALVSVYRDGIATCVTLQAYAYSIILDAIFEEELFRFWNRVIY